MNRATTERIAVMIIQSYLRRQGLSIDETLPFRGKARKRKENGGPKIPWLVLEYIENEV